MHLVFDDGEAGHDVEIVVHGPDPCVADLAAALAGTGGAAPALSVDGRPLAPDRRLDRAGLTDGATIRLGPPTPDALMEQQSPVAVLEVVGGVASGERRLLPAGHWSIGRHAADVTIDEPTVSTLHSSVRIALDGAVTVVDHGSFNGTWLGERAVVAPTDISRGAIVRVGASQLQIGRPLAEDRSPAGDAGRRFTGGRTRPFNRPPRVFTAVHRDPVEPPTAPADARSTSAVGLISAVAPLVLGLVMVKVFHNWMYAMFALLSPVMLVGNAIESKRRDRTATKRHRARYAKELVAFRTTLSEAAAVERDRRHERLPAPPEIVRRSAGPSPRLWERRPDHDDFLLLRAGLGTARWDPPIEQPVRSLDDDVRQVVEEVSRLPATPIAVDLRAGGVTGIIGPRPAALALARSLVAQAAVLHGPADLPVAVLAAPEGGADWDWAKWLPHTIDQSGSGRRLLAADPDAADRLLRTILEEQPTGPAGAGDPTLLLVVDDDSLTNARRSPARSVLRGMAGPVAGIVLAGSEDRLPAVCTTVIEVTSEHGEALVHEPATGDRIDDLLVGGMTQPAARAVARALAGLEDPEVHQRGASLPASVHLLPLLGLDHPAAESIGERWAAAGADPPMTAPIGVAEDGVLALDLVRDGPHALVAGTTGSGKSELLRSLVVGLAAGSSPEHVGFVLIDFKGGSAFDECARLPHVVGMVTDLDERLGARALRCLDAELRHRERRLRSAGVSDLTAYRRLAGEREVIPRLVVVIDEFATLKAELPDFVDALVGVAQRGRSLGVHLVLATQRPAGAVSENIRANTNLRICLRVQDANDSQDVLDLPDAASIGRHSPGRGLARLGPGEVVALQTALSTTSSCDTGADHRSVEVRPFLFAPTATTGSPAVTPPHDPTRPTDLSRLVDAIGEAFHRTGRPPPRRPWPDPLPDLIDLDALLDSAPSVPFGAPDAVVPFALADLPDQQRQCPAGWVPADGNLLLVGVGGSGTTTALSAIALAAARATGPAGLHLHLLDFGAGDLVPLGDLPHTGSVIRADEPERQVRLMRYLTAEVRRRRALADPRLTEARILLLLDGLAGFRSTWDETDTPGMMDDLVRVFADGPEVGVHCAIAADRPGAVPTAVSGLARQRLVLRLGETLDYGIFGLSARDVPDLAPGGAVMAESGTETRVGLPSPDLATAVKRLIAALPFVVADRSERPPQPIAALPTEVDATTLVPAARLRAHPWFIPLGIGDRSLQPVGLTLHAGEHALVAGPARSGRTTALCTIAVVIRGALPTATIVAVASTRSALADEAALDQVLSPDVTDAVTAIADGPGPVLVLVDDAEEIGDGTGAIATLLERRRTDLHIVAAGRAEALRSQYAHWTRRVRASRNGLLLQPDVDLDGDLFGTRLPRRAPVLLGPGRGYLVAGAEVDIVQVASDLNRLT